MTCGNDMLNYFGESVSRERIQELLEDDKYTETESFMKDVFRPTLDCKSILFDDSHRIVVFYNSPEQIGNSFYAWAYMYDDIRGCTLLNETAKKTERHFFGPPTRIVVGNIIRIEIRISDDPDRSLEKVRFTDKAMGVNEPEYKRGLKNAKTALAKLENIIDDNKNKTYNPPRQSIPSSPRPQTSVKSTLSPYDEVKKLKELLDIGAISQAEFDKKKSELLDL